MSLVANAEQAEIVAEEWLKRRYAKRLANVRFSEVMLDGSSWTVKVDFAVKGDLLDKKKGRVTLKIDSQSLGVVGYTDESEYGKSKLGH
jgi:hypothetical protein